MGPDTVFGKVVSIMKQIVWSVFVLLVTCAPVFAQVEISGSWVARQHEDWQERGPGPDVFTLWGLPLNPEGRARALRYSTSSLSLPERQCLYYPPHYVVL